MRSYSVFLSLSDISLSIMSSKSIHIVKWQYFLLSHLWIIFQCVYVPIFLFHSSFNGHPSYFHTYDFLVYCRAASCVILGKPWPHFLCIYFCYLLIWLHWILVAACGIFVAVWGLCSCVTGTPEFWGSDVALYHLMGSAAAQHVGSYFPNQRWQLRPLHDKADS